MTVCGYYRNPIANDNQENFQENQRYHAAAHIAHFERVAVSAGKCIHFLQLFFPVMPKLPARKIVAGFAEGIAMYYQPAGPLEASSSSFSSLSCPSFQKSRLFSLT